PRLAVLDRDLHVVEARVREFRKPLGIDADAGRDEVAVKSGGARRGNDLNQVAARARLSAGEMELQNAQRGGLPEDARPGLRIELAIAAVERNWIRAIG